jgi:hypothetical protein
MTFFMKKMHKNWKNRKIIMVVIKKTFELW